MKQRQGRKAFVHWGSNECVSCSVFLKGALRWGMPPETSGPDGLWQPLENNAPRRPTNGTLKRSVYLVEALDPTLQQRE